MLIKMPPAIMAVVASVVGTARPSAIAGTAISGNAQSVASWSNVPAARPTPIASPGTPARASMRYCTAAAVAVPPGRTRPRAPDTSIDRPTTRTLAPPMQSAWSLARHHRLPA